MKTPQRIAVVAFALATPATALAWESKCFQYPDETLEAEAFRAASGTECTPEAGPNAVRHRWVGELDEHRQIWELARVLSGIPDGASRTVHLRVFTGPSDVSIRGQHFMSLVPVAFENATRAQNRSFSPGELAQLPDFSYSLWDWATGNESCPLGNGVNVDAVDCHDFATHMGPVNANHFLPQAGEFYRRLHQLAVGRAAECRALATAVAPAAQRFAPYVRDCDHEALAIEAVAQHYLQDAWSMGHMWQRWGSSELSDTPGGNDEDRRSRAVLVALASGLIHGARAALQALPTWTTYDVNDALCAPNDDVRFVSNGRIEHGVGDGYLHEMVHDPPGTPPSPTYAYQYSQMMACTTAGMLQVYQSSAQSDGPVNASLPFARVTVDPTGPECWNQRATNLAMQTGAGVQFRVLGSQSFLEMDARFVNWALPTAGTTGGNAQIDPFLRANYRLELARAVTVLRILTRNSPNTTEAADGALGDILGVHPNGAYVGRNPVASYVDPDLPWPATRDTNTPHASERAAALARTFHRAHAADWCAAVTDAELRALQSHARDTSLDPMSRSAACEACAEVAVRHLRVGTDARHHDTANEPLCTFVARSPALVYQPAAPASDAPALARAWCGCQ